MCVARPVRRTIEEREAMEMEFAERGRRDIETQCGSLCEDNAGRAARFVDHALSEEGTGRREEALEGACAGVGIMEGAQVGGDLLFFPLREVGGREPMQEDVAEGARDLLEKGLDGEVTCHRWSRAHGCRHVRRRGAQIERRESR